MSISIDHSNNALEPEDPYAAIFWETYHLLEEDIEWLIAEPHSEFSLLCRYFHNHARSVKDYLEYCGLLRGCLENLNNPMVQVTDLISTLGDLNALMEWTPEELFERQVMETIREEIDWLQSSPRTTQEIAATHFPEIGGTEESRSDMLLLLMICMKGSGFRAHSRIDGRMAWLWIDGREVA